jgi:hypothetical protein
MAGMDENSMEQSREPISVNVEPRGRKRTRNNRHERLLAWLVVLTVFTVQLLVCAVLRFGDIGFDHPGRFGLDFDDFLLLLAIQGGLFVLSVALAIWLRRSALLMPQLAIVLLTLACCA